ncbi:hypothetical protein Smp_163010 [Schistosoma mansoni]|uniref:hypothetical protein n=1 Tax=Schistosoma mansoni TaxID=6183 RepID=UPI00022C8765|nr:hypothetical protein Smp_163010 [Schistosoma mansoni]|eukprot:XP_018645520.1 hypothetical protein Smp_163010 [Schistosoma mansoni]
MKYVHNFSAINFGVKEDRVDCVAFFNSIIMITPNELQHSLDVNALQSVSKNLYHPPAKMAAIAASQSHCTRPSSVPGCFEHRGFSVSTKNQLSPVNSDNLSLYSKISPIYQLSLSPTTITCNEEHISPSLRGSALDDETSQKDYVPANSPQSTLVTQYSSGEDCMPPFHYSNSPHLRNPSSSDSSPISIEHNKKHNAVDKSNNDSNTTSNNKESELAPFDFPKLCTKSDGGFALNLPTDVILPEDNKGQSVWNYHQRLMDVIITVVNRSGKILYYDRNLPRQHSFCLDNNDNDNNYANLQTGDSWTSRIQDGDLAIWEKHTSKIFDEASRWSHARNALLEQSLLPINNDDGEVGNQQHKKIESSNSNSLIPSENSSNRHLFDCPIYRVKLGQKWFYVHTFSLPINRCSDSSLLQSDMSLCEPLVVHYHNLRGCDQNVESTGSNASICLKKAIAQSTLSMDLTETNCSNSFKNTVVIPSSSVCENPISSHLIMSTANDHYRIDEPSNGSSKNPLSTGTCLSYIGSPDPSVTGGQKLVFNSISPPPSSPLVLPHHHHVHLTHCHHHHPNEIHDGTAVTSTTNNHHHHHHYVRHHHTPNTSHNSPQPVIVSHLPHQNSIGEKSTWSSDTSHRPMLFVPTSSSSTIKSDNISKSPILVVRKSSSQSHSEHSSTTDNNTVQYGNTNVIGTYCDNNSLLSDISGDSMYEHFDTAFIPTSCNEEFHSRSNTYHYNSNSNHSSNSAVVYSTGNTSESLSDLSFTNTRLPQNNVINSATENVNDGKILMLQHLLPPQAIQEIRQIWQEMNRLIKCNSEISRMPLKSSASTIPVTTTTTAEIPNSSSHNVSNVVRENFARRVRQVVRQYLGPKAFITDNLPEPRSEIDSCFKTDDIVMLQSDNSQELGLSTLDYDENGKNSAYDSVINVIEGTNPSFTRPFILSTITTIPSTKSLCASVGSSDTTSSTIGMFSPEISNKLFHNETNIIESNSGVLCPNVTATCATSSKINDTGNTVQKISTSCDETVSNSPLSSCIKQTDERIVSQPLNNNKNNINNSVSNETPYTSSTGNLPRVSTNSQCCMLEWLLSEEADLCILPPSLCQSKVGDKPQQQSISGISPPSSSSLHSQVISPRASCCMASSSQTHNFQYGSPVLTEVAYSPISMSQQKINSELQVNNRSLFSSSNSGSLITTTTTVGAGTVTSSVNLSYVEIRSSQPRTESLLVRLLHPAKNHSVGHHTDMNTSDGGHLLKLSSPTLPRSVAVTSQLVPDTTDFNTSNIITNTESEINNLQRQLNNRKSECRLIAVSLDNLCNNQPTTNSSKRCRSGPATTQSISSPFSPHMSPGNKRTRHASQFEEVPSPSIRKNSGISEAQNSDVIPSPPFTSLTQLLLQDFPLVSDIISYSSVDSPKYTSLFGQNDYQCKSTKSFSNAAAQGYENLQCNMITSHDRSKIISSNISQSDHCHSINPPSVVTSEKCTSQGLFINSNNVTFSKPMSSSFDHQPNDENTLSTFSWSTLSPNSNVKSKLESKDKYFVKTNKDSENNSTSSLIPGQSSICQLLLDAQLEPEEISDAVANVENYSNLSFNNNTFSTINKCKEERNSDDTSSFKINLQFTSIAYDNQPFSRLLASTTSTSSCGGLSSTGPTNSCSSILPPPPSSYSIAPVEWNDDDLQQLIHEAITNPNDALLEENNRNTSSSCSSSLDLPKRHPSTSSKEISEEVEILCEILRRDELERNNEKNEYCHPNHESPSSKRSRFSSSTSISDHQVDTVGDNMASVDGDFVHRDEVNWQNDAKAVARICEQLQQGLVTEKLPVTSSNNDSNNGAVTEFSGYSVKINDHNNSSTPALSSNTPDYSIPRNDIIVSLKHVSPVQDPDTNTNTQNMNVSLLNLNATTVISSNSPSFSSTSKSGNFYHYYHHHRPEDLSRFLKEVGPNVQVQLSCSIPTIDNHQLSNTHKTPYVNPALHHRNTVKMQRPSAKHQLIAKTTPITPTTPSSTSSIFHNSQTFVLQSSSIGSLSSSLSSRKTSSASPVYCSHSSTVSNLSSVNNPNKISREDSIVLSQKHFPFVDNNNNSCLFKTELHQGLVDLQGIHQNDSVVPATTIIITTDNNHSSFQCSQVSNKFSDDSLPITTYQACSSTEVDQSSPAATASTSSLSSSLSYVSRVPSSSLMAHNESAYSNISCIESPMNSVHCPEWSLPQPVFVQHQKINSDFDNISLCNNTVYPQSVYLAHSYRSQVFPNSHKTNNNHKIDTSNYLTRNDSSYCNNNTLMINHSNIVYPLTPCNSLSPISVSANTSPSSSTTSGYLKSPPPPLPPSACQQSIELAYSTSSSSLDTLVNNYYEINSTNGSYDCCFNNYSSYPTFHRNLSTTSNSSTISYNYNHTSQDTPVTTIIDPHLESMLQSNYKHQYQQQNEENLLPDDLINDVFDLEIMIATKQQREYHHHNSTTNELRYLTVDTPPVTNKQQQQQPQLTLLNNSNVELSTSSSRLSSPSILNATNQCSTTTTTNTSGAAVIVVVTR